MFVDRVIGLLGLAVFAGAALLVAPERDGLRSRAPRRRRRPRRVCLAASRVLAMPGVRRALGLDASASRGCRSRRSWPRSAPRSRLYRDRPVALLVALAISLVNHAANAFCVWLLAGALGIEGLDLGTALALVPVANLFSGDPAPARRLGRRGARLRLPLRAGGDPADRGRGPVRRLPALRILAVSLPGGVLWLFWKDRPTKEAIQQEVDGGDARGEVDRRADATPGGAPSGDDGGMARTAPDLRRRALLRRTSVRGSCGARPSASPALDGAFRPPQTDDFHLTVQFLGDTDEGGRRRDRDGPSRRRRRAVPPFDVAYGGLGAFPDAGAGARRLGRRPRELEAPGQPRAPSPRAVGEALDGARATRRSAGPSIPT